MHNLEELKNIKAFWLTLAIGGILVLGVIALGLTAEKKSALNPVVSSTTNNKAVLSLKTIKNSVSSEEDFTVDLSLDTLGQKITAADIYLIYDSESLEMVSLTSGKIFSSYPNLKLKKPGEILISGLNSSASEFAQNGVLAQVNFKAKKPGSTQISINNNSLAAFEGKNVLDNSQLRSLTMEIK